ncbi:MAG: hypothetical protein GY754_40485 [bacterium]|nr:hypothetical protein [bacterium]
MKRKSFLLVFTAVVLMGITEFAAARITENTFMSRAEQRVLRKGTIITRAKLKFNKNISTGKKAGRIRIPRTRFTAKNYLKYESLCVEKAFIPYKLNKQSKLSLYNALAAYSRLSNTRYYSRSDKKTQPLILKSFRVASASSNSPAADKTYTRISPKVSNYFKLKDNRFGYTRFKSSLYNEGNNFVLDNVSLEAMNKYMLTINKKGEYGYTYFFLYNKKAGGYYYYAISYMRIRKDYFIKLGLTPHSMANRLRASFVRYAKLLGLNRAAKIRAF